jgi:hypothetical protein
MKNKQLDIIVKYNKNDYNNDELKLIEDKLKKLKKINDKIAFIVNLKLENNQTVKIEEGPFILHI